MKKFLYGILIFLVALIILIVVAANSSYVVKRVADVFAPDYNISYRKITGNIFTGIKIDGLKFDKKELVKQVRFSWNPSKLLYGHIAVGTISIEDADIDAIKALINSLGEDDENTTGGSFPLVVDVSRVHISLRPFVVQDIDVQKAVLDAKGLSYAADAVEVKDLKLHIDSNVSDMQMHASLEEGVLKIYSLDTIDIDSQALQAVFEAMQTEEETKNNSEEGEVSPFTPRKVEVQHLNASLKPRLYLGASIDTFNVKIDDLKADIEKIVANESGAVEIGQVFSTLKSDKGEITVDGALSNDIVTINSLLAVKLDTVALQTMFAPDSNVSAVGNSSKTVSKATSGAEEQEQTAAQHEQTNALIPKEVVLKKLHIDMVPAVYEPVHIHSLALDGKHMVLDIPNLIIKEGAVTLSGQTNMSNIEEHSTIKNNHLVGHIVLTPNQHLFDFYKLPLRKKAIGDIAADFTASTEKLTVDLHARANHILQLPKDTNATDINTTDVNATVPFNIDINDLNLHAVYEFQQKRADLRLNMNVTTPFAKESTLDARFDMDDEVLAYEGVLKAGRLEGYDAALLKPLSGLKIMFHGDEKEIKTTIDSAGLSGYFNVPDFNKKGVLHLETKSPVALKEMVTLPDALQAAKAELVVDVPLNFEKLDPINGKAAIRSNLANFDADIVYGKKASLDLLATIPEDSLLKNLDKNIKWEAVSPMKLHASLDEKKITATLKSQSVSGDMTMLPFAGTVEGKMKLNGMSVTLQGDKSGVLILQSRVSSFKDLTRTVERFYHLSKPPKIEGRLNLLAVLQKSGDMMLQVNSDQVLYQADRRTVHEINDVHLSVGIAQNELSLNAYHVNYNGMVFYATRPSQIDFKGETVYLSEVWLNDQLKTTGELNTKTMHGEIRADASRFHFSHPLIDADAKVHIKTLFQGENTDITGDITLLEGEVHYDLNTQNFPSDSDILIVQEMKEDKPSPFMDHLSIALHIGSQKPLVYKEGSADIKAKVDIQVHKAIFTKPMILGTIDIVDGSSYLFQGKKFVLERSHIYLTGDPAKPVLDLTVKYKALRHLITINITGTPAVPNVLFSSVPSLSKEQILSIILFDSEEAAGTNNANDMMKMMGGAMAKSALNDLGVKIDHLVFGEGGSVEVGKKLTKNVTVIYINGEVPEVKVKYQYNPSLDIVIGASERSESIDAVYIKDFNLRSKQEDIVIKGRKH